MNLDHYPEKGSLLFVAEGKVCPSLDVWLVVRLPVVDLGSVNLLVLAIEAVIGCL